MAEHRLAELAPVRNSPGYRAGRPQWAATCSCGHIDVALSRGHAGEYHERHVAQPESAHGADDG